MALWVSAIIIMAMTTLFEIVPQKNIRIQTNASSLDELTGGVSDGFYTTFSTLGGGAKVTGLQAHLDRLFLPAWQLRLRPAVDEETLRRRIYEIAREYLPHESRLRLILTRDEGRIYIAAQAFTPIPDSVYEKGVHVVSVEMARHDPRIKGTDFITQSAQQRELVKGDIFEILLTRNGGILEGMTSNFYAVRSAPARRDGRLLHRGEQPPRADMATLVTAQKGILLGVTRRAVLRIARGAGMLIEYRSPGVDENFDEALLTSSSRGVVPIVKIDGRAVGQGKPGAWTKRLSLAYQAYVEESGESIVRL